MSDLPIGQKSGTGNAGAESIHKTGGRPSVKFQDLPLVVENFLSSFPYVYVFGISMASRNF